MKHSQTHETHHRQNSILLLPKAHSNKENTAKDGVLSVVSFVCLGMLHCCVTYSSSASSFCFQADSVSILLMGNFHILESAKLIIDD
jgi:hypothetical protein